MLSLVATAIACGILLLGAFSYYGTTLKSGYRLNTEFYDALERIDCREGKTTNCPSHLQ